MFFWIDEINDIYEQSDVWLMQEDGGVALESLSLSTTLLHLSLTYVNSY